MNQTTYFCKMCGKQLPPDSDYLECPDCEKARAAAWSKASAKAGRHGTLVQRKIHILDEALV